MGWLKRAPILVAVLALPAIAACSADTTDHRYCDVSRTGYKNALAEVIQALGKYSSCIGRGTGYPDCSGQFDDLQSAQANLNRSVSDVGQYCPTVQ